MSVSAESGKTPPGSPAAYIDFRDYPLGPIVPADHAEIAAVVNAIIGLTPDGINAVHLDGLTSFVRLVDMVTSDSAEFCEYTIMGWFKTHSLNVGATFDPIINRQLTDANRTFWVTLWEEGAFGWTGQPLVQRVSHLGGAGYFDVAVGDGVYTPPTLPFRDAKWHFFAVNMKATGVAGKGAHATACIDGGPYTSTLYGSVAGPTLLVGSQQRPLGPDVGENPPDPNVYPIEIGRDSASFAGDFFHGYISEIVIYKRGETLSDNQIRAWYDATKGQYP